MFPHPTHPTRLRPRRALALGSALAALAGCVNQEIPSRPLSPGFTAAALSARTLRDDGLRRFLAQNLGHEPAVWDFETLSWVAFYFHPSLEVARAQWDTARAAQKTATSRPNPTLTFTPGYSTNPGAGTSPWFPAINFDFLLENSRKRDQRAAIENFAAESARLAVLSAAWQVRSDLRRALAEAAALDRRHRLLHAQADLQQQLMTLLEQRQQAGVASALELSAVRVALLKAEAAASEAHHQVPVARSRIAQSLGVPLAALDGVKFDDVPVAPALSADALEAARRQSLQSRADILGALARYESAQASLQLETTKRYPDIHLGPGYQWDQGQNKWTLGLTVELPLFNRNEGPIAEAGARRNEAAAQLDAVQAQVIAAIDTAAAAQAGAIAQLERLRQVRTEQEKQTALVQARLAAGSADQVENQTARIELSSTDLLLSDLEATAAVASGQLEDALQIPFPNLNAIASASRDATQPRTP